MVVCIFLYINSNRKWKEGMEKAINTNLTQACVRVFPCVSFLSSSSVSFALSLSVALTPLTHTKKGGNKGGGA